MADWSKLDSTKEESTICRLNPFSFLTLLCFPANVATMPLPAVSVAGARTHTSLALIKRSLGSILVTITGRGWPSPVTSAICQLCSLPTPTPSLLGRTVAIYSLSSLSKSHLVAMERELATELSCPTKASSHLAGQPKSRVAIMVSSQLAGHSISHLAPDNSPLLLFPAMSRQPFSPPAIFRPRLYIPYFARCTL